MIGNTGDAKIFSMLSSGRLIPADGFVEVRLAGTHRDVEAAALRLLLTPGFKRETGICWDQRTFSDEINQVSEAYFLARFAPYHGGALSAKTDALLD